MNFNSTVKLHWTKWLCSLWLQCCSVMMMVEVPALWWRRRQLTVIRPSTWPRTDLWQPLTPRVFATVHTLCRIHLHPLRPLSFSVARSSVTFSISAYEYVAFTQVSYKRCPWFSTSKRLFQAKLVSYMSNELHRHWGSYLLRVNASVLYEQWMWR